MKLQTTARNVFLTARTLFEHLGDDPMVLMLQISRRVPVRVLDPVVLGVDRLVGGTAIGPLCSIVRGDHETAESRLSAAVSAGASGRRALHLADVATAGGLGVLADRLISRVGPGTPGRLGTIARRRWHAGDMSGAVEILQAGGPTERRQQRRLASELTVFKGWVPSLRPVEGYSPDNETVLHVVTNSLPHTGSGYAQRTHSILKAQSELGWNVHAVTRPGYPVQVGKLFARDRDDIDGVTYHRLLPARLPSGMQQRLQQQAEHTLALAMEVRPAVLHTTTHFVNGLVAAAVADALGIPWVYEVRGQLADTWASTRSEEARFSERYELFRACEAQVMARAELVPTLGTVMAREIASTGLSSERVRLLPNAVGERYLDEPLPAAEARRHLGLDTGTELIGTVSSLVDYEGLDDLITAFSFIADRMTQLNCLVVGDGPAGPRLRALTAELGLADRVIFTGRVPRDQAHLYHQALDIFVVPRKDLKVTRAVTPLKPVEAMACARPVIASALPALEELVQDGVNGLLVRPSDPRCLADRISALMTDPLLRRDLGRSGRRQVLATRTWASVAASTLGMYREVGSDS